VIVDHFFHRLGARHGGFGTQQGRARAKGKSRHMPKRAQQGRSYLSVGYQSVKPVQMAAFLFCHFADRCFGIGTGQYGELTLIDTDRPMFAGMIDPYHGINQLSLSWITGHEAFSGTGWFFCHRDFRLLLR
jgi:hypothetical protein